MTGKTCPQLSILLNWAEVSEIIYLTLLVLIESDVFVVVSFWAVWFVIWVGEIRVFAWGDCFGFLLSR